MVFINVTGLLLLEGRLGSTLGILAAGLGLLMVTGQYLRQRKESGTLGVISCILVFLGTALAVGIASTNAYGFSSLSESMQAESLTGIAGTTFLVSMVINLVGVILFFGYTKVKAGVFLRGVALLVLVGFILVSLFMVLPDIVSTFGAATGGVGLVWFGYALWSSTGTMVGEAELAT